MDCEEYNFILHFYFTIYTAMKIKCLKSLVISILIKYYETTWLSIFKWDPGVNNDHSKSFDLLFYNLLGAITPLN